MNNKRNLLKALSVAGVTGAAWQKPAVNAVMLPAHALTSGCGEWLPGELEGGDDEIDTGVSFDTNCECEEFVKTNYPTATGASWGVAGGGDDNSCYAEFGTNTRDNDDAFESTIF